MLEKQSILDDNKDKSGIYLLTHLESNKMYVGSSENLYRRFKYYYSKANLTRNTNSRICNALLHYGHSAFSLTILEYVNVKDLTKSEAKDIIISREQFYIDLLNPEYNILRTAGSLFPRGPVGTAGRKPGFKHSAITIAKFKKAKINENNPMFSKFHTEETKLKMSNLKIGKLHSDDTKLKIGLTNSRKVFIFKFDPILGTKILIKIFKNYTEASQYFNCSIRTLSRYIDKDIIYKKEFYIYTKDISK